MRETFVGREIARTTRNSLLAHLALLGLLAWHAVENRAFLADLLSGPKVVAPALLAAATSPDDLGHTRIQVTPEHLFPLGQRVQRSSSGQETVVADFAGAVLAGHVLTVRFPPHLGPPDGGVVGTPLTGTLSALSADTRRALPDALPPSQVVPLLLDTTDEAWGDWIGVLLVAAIAGWSFWRLKLALERRADPARHPAARRLAAYGDVTQQARALDAGLAESKGGLHLLGATLGPEFLFNRYWFDTMVLPTSGIIWIYKKVTKKSVNFIPTGKDYHIVLRGAHGELVELETTEAGVDQALLQLAKAVPWAIMGYDPQIEPLVSTAAGRMKLESVVRARREALGQGTASVA